MKLVGSLRCSVNIALLGIKVHRVVLDERFAQRGREIEKVTGDRLPTHCLHEVCDRSTAAKRIQSGFKIQPSRTPWIQGRRRLLEPI